MKLSEFKNIISELNELNFVLPNGAIVPPYFHVTEIAKIEKSFIDCGGTMRKENKITFQLWVEEKDKDHRLSPEKLTKIIELSQSKLFLDDLELEVEYQNDTIGKYSLSFENNSFLLENTYTACLAEDQCGVPQEKPRIKMSDLSGETCTPGGGCC